MYDDECVGVNYIPFSDFRELKTIQCFFFLQFSAIKSHPLELSCILSTKYPFGPRYLPCFEKIGVRILTHNVNSVMIRAPFSVQPLRALLVKSAWTPLIAAGSCVLFLRLFLVFSCSFLLKYDTHHRYHAYGFDSANLVALRFTVSLAVLAVCLR